MTGDEKPFGGHVLRQVPALNAELEGEATPLVRTEEVSDVEEMTPVIDRVPTLHHDGEVTDPVIDQQRVGSPYNPVRLPRTGLEELDSALADLESAMTGLVPQDRRLVVVLGCCFVSLFMPWFQVWNQGPSRPTTAVSGLELAGLSCLLLIISLVVVILAQRMSDDLLRGRRRLFIRLFTAALLARVVVALVGAPVDQIPWRHSAWAIVPFVLCLALAAALMHRLPAFPRRPLPPS